MQGVYNKILSIHPLRYVRLLAENLGVRVLELVPEIGFK